MNADAFRFLRAYMESPGKIAAVAPSSPYLAQLIAREIEPDEGPVIELGPGTGAFTRELLKRGLPPERLVLVESSPQFARILHRRYPRVRVLPMDAARLRTTALFDGDGAAATISGLPLLSMPAGKILSVLAGAFQNLGPGGAFIQFTYGFTCPVPRRVLDRLDLVSSRTGFTMANMPPASVFRITRR